jgi:hypothetical protein
MFKKSPKNHPVSNKKVISSASNQIMNSHLKSRHIINNHAALAAGWTKAGFYDKACFKNRIRREHHADFLCVLCALCGLKILA